jgi:rubrerythrin
MSNNCDITKEGLLNNFYRGLELEKRALVCYQEMIDSLSSEEDKKIIASIVEDEKKHIKITNRLVEITNNYYSVNN